MRVSRLTATDELAQYGLRDPGGHRSDGTEVPALPIQQRPTQYGPSRFVDLPLWDNETQSAIRSVGFGPSADPNNEASMQRAAIGNSEVKFWKSDVPLR